VARRVGPDARNKGDRRFIYLLNVAQRRVQHWTREQYGEITAAQAGALFVLGKADGVLIGEVARMLGTGASATTGLLDRMEAAGLVERRPDENDGRAARLFLTAKGRTARVAAKARATAINARLVDGFSDAELDTVARWLHTVQERFAKENDT
jgi:DNA-binding MarR family transcriptional regulator